MLNVRKTAVIGLLVGLGLIMHVVESMIPMSAIIPGARLGLANIVNLLGMVLFGFFSGLQILLLRIILGSLLIGSFMSLSFYLSLFGGLIGYLAMGLIYYLYQDKFSLIGVSVAGAVFHNIGQVLTVFYIISNPGIFYYLPFLLLLAIPTGIGVGLVSIFVIDYLPERKDIYGT